MSFKVNAKRDFANGSVYALELDDGMPVEVTDTFLPYYTKDAVGPHQNRLKSDDFGSRRERWMVGVSCMSGCPVGCKFCATAQLDGWRKLTGEEIVDQVEFIIQKHNIWPCDAQEFKINYTRMGEPFLNIVEVRRAIEMITAMYGPKVHHYISTIGVQGSDFSWIKDNVTLQISLHALNEDRRKWLIPFTKLLSLEELGQIRTGSNLKTTLNLSLVEESDFDIDALTRYFDPEHFFIKLSPINPNDQSDSYDMGTGIIQEVNLA